MELVSRIVSRALDRGRPLWEIYVVEGLSQGRIALLYKTHHVLVDGVHTVDLGQVLLDASPAPKALGGDEWHPRPAPSPAHLLAGAVRESLTSREILTDTVRSTSVSLARTAEDSARRGRKVLNALTGRGPERETVFSGALSQQRRVVTVDTELEDYRTVRAAPPPAPIREAIKGGGYDAVAFTSSSTVRNLVGIAGKPHPSTVIACIGPATAKTAEEHGLRVDVLAATPSVADLVTALSEHGQSIRSAAVAAGEPVLRPSQKRAPARRKAT